MTVIVALFILVAPIVVAATLAWAAHQTNASRIGVSGDTIDAARMEHEIDAIRSRFERQPAWPSSGALGERR